MLFKEKYNLEASEAAVFSLITSNGSIQALKNKNGNSQELEDLFKELLIEFISEIYDFEVSFIHNADAKYCAYCA